MGTPFSAEQKAAVTSRKGYLRIIAVPGSGKTTVFVKRVNDLLLEVRPEQILAVTFSKEGALEMEGRSGIKHQAHKYRVFRTFHGWALDFICREVNSLPYPAEHWPLLTPLEASRILSRVCKQVEGVKYRDAQDYIERMQRAGISPELAREKAEGSLGPLYAAAYRRYTQACKTAGQNGKALLDFNTVIYETVKLLENPEVRRRNSPDYLMIDEAQDTDAVQWRIVQLLGHKGNVFAVGDPRQNMYTWRGSEAEGLLDKFAERFPGAQTLPLSTNYRSTKAICRYLNEIDPYRDAGFPPITAAPNAEEGVPPDFIRYSNSYEEAKATCKDITDPENTAVLCRTNRQLQAYERCCGEMNLKYRLLGKSGFFNQEEIKHVTDLIKYCFNPSDQCISRIIKGPFEPTRFIRKKEAVDRLLEMQRGSVGTVSLSRLLGNFSSYDSSQTQAVRELDARLKRMRQAALRGTARDGLKSILDIFGVLDHYGHGEAVDNDPLDNIRSLETIANAKPTLADLLDTIMRALAAARGKKDRVTLSTVHQAKGKEWKHVYVAGVDVDVLPHKNGELKEEERIYFVACSRAAKRLHVTCVMPSPFIKSRAGLASLPTGNPDLLMEMYRLAEVKE